MHKLLHNTENGGEPGALGTVPMREQGPEKI